jgi:hypothetical protein
VGDINEMLCELLGIKYYLSRVEKPDFFSPTGRIDLLRRMENHPNGKLFFAQLVYAGDNVEAIDDDGLIPRSYITDDNGALARVALEFLEGKHEE